MKDLTKFCIVTGQPTRSGGRRIHLRQSEGESATIVAVYAVNPDVKWTPALKAEKEAAVLASLAAESASVASVPAAPAEGETVSGEDVPVEKRKLKGTQ